MSYFEPFLDERLQAAKKDANNVLSAKCSTTSEFHDFLIAFLSKHYNKPFFDPFWENLTIEQLYFEFTLASGQFKASNEITSELVKDNIKEVQGMFDDWAPPKAALSPKMQQVADNFMKTGEWKK